MQFDAKKSVEAIKVSIAEEEQKKIDAKNKILADINIRAKFSKALRLMYRSGFSYRIDHMINKYDQAVKEGASRDEAIDVAIWEGAKYSDVFNHESIQEAIDYIKDYDPKVVSVLAKFKRNHPLLAAVALIVGGITAGLAVVFAFDQIFGNAAWDMLVIWPVMIVYVWKMMQISEI